MTNVTFLDYDLDITEIGGPITWDGPDIVDAFQFLHVSARDFRGCGWSSGLLRKFPATWSTSHALLRLETGCVFD